MSNDTWGRKKNKSGLHIPQVIGRELKIGLRSEGAQVLESDAESRF